MPDVIEKVVQYEIRGNTVNLEQTLAAAINNVNALQTKLQTVATSYYRGKQDSAFYDRQSTISKTVAQLESLKTKLSSESIQAVTPDQLALLSSINKELDSYINKIVITNGKNMTTKKTFEKMRATISDMNFTLKKASIGVDSFATAWQNLSKKLIIIKLIARYVEKFYTAASSFVETINLFNVAVGDANKELSEFVLQMSNAFGLDIEPLYRATAIFKQLANTLGDVSDASITFSKGATQLVYDLSSLYNVDVDTMLQAFKSGLTGQTKPMMKYGISVHKATLEQVALAKGITKTYSEMNEVEKMYLRYITMLDQASNAQGDMAKTLESPANQLRVAKDQVTMLTRNLGALTIMISKMVLPIFNGFVSGLNNVLSALNDAAGYEIPDYSNNLSANNQMLDEGTDSIEEYEDAVNGLLSPLDEINQANTSKADLGLGTVDQSILNALDTYDNLMDQVSTATQKFAGIFNAVFDEQIFVGIGQVIGTTFTTVSAVIDTVSGVLTTMAPTINLISKAVGYLLTGVTWLIDKALIPLQAFLKGIEENAWLLVAAFAALNLLQLAVTGEFKSMMAVKIIQFFMSLAAKIWANVSALLANAKATITAKLESAALAIAVWWETAAWWAKAAAVIAAAGMLAAVVAVMALGASSMVVAQGKSSMNTTANSVPQMAKGGVVTRATPAIIGEGRYDEAVIPLGRSPQMRELKRDIANETSRKISQPHSVVQQDSARPIVLKVDGRELGRTSINNIGRVRRQVGVNLS